MLQLRFTASHHQRLLPISGGWCPVVSLLCDQRFQPRQALLEFRVLLLQRFDLLLLLRYHLVQLRLDLALQREAAARVNGAQFAGRVYAYDCGWSRNGRAPDALDVGVRQEARIPSDADGFALGRRSVVPSGIANKYVVAPRGRLACSLADENVVAVVVSASSRCPNGNVGSSRYVRLTGAFSHTGVGISRYGIRASHASDKGVIIPGGVGKSGTGTDASVCPPDGSGACAHSDREVIDTKNLQHRVLIDLVRGSVILGVDVPIHIEFRRGVCGRDANEIVTGLMKDRAAPNRVETQPLGNEKAIRVWRATARNIAAGGDGPPPKFAVCW